MIVPSTGLMAFHNGRPVELLHIIGTDAQDGSVVWAVRPLFIEAPDREEVFRPGDRLTPLHSKTH